MPKTIKDAYDKMHQQLHKKPKMKCPKKNPTTNECRRCPLLKECEDGKLLIDLEAKLF